MSAEYQFTAAGLALVERPEFAINRIPTTAEILRPAPPTPANVYDFLERWAAKGTPEYHQRFIQSLETNRKHERVAGVLRSWRGAGDLHIQLADPFEPLSPSWNEMFFGPVLTYEHLTGRLTMSPEAPGKPA